MAEAAGNGVYDGPCGIKATTRAQSEEADELDEAVEELDEDSDELEADELEEPDEPPRLSFL